MQKNKGKEYNDVKILKYSSMIPELKHISLKSRIIQACKWLKNTSSSNDWSVAILVPTNTLMLEISDVLQKEQTFSNNKTIPSIPHEVAIDSAGPSLAALFVALLLEKGSTKDCQVIDVLEVLSFHILGRKGGDPPSKADTEVALAIQKFISNGKIIGKNRKALVAECDDIANSVNNISFTGNIISDWKSIIETIKKASSPYIKKVVNDVKYLRLLQRGSQLYSSLNSLWRNNNSYSGASDAISLALTQEHFSMSTKKWSGVNVMTIHKAKGKEFDVVIIYEGRYQSRIVSKPERIDQSRLNLRVAVTRAKKCALIITPEEDPCPLL